MSEVSYLKEKIYNHRKILNPIAELGRMEYKTSKYIRTYLKNIGVEYEIYLETGVVGMIKGKNPKKNIAFRADIDGLSTDNGVKHLCGHDGHTSILLGLIEFLINNKSNLNDNIVFIFQPAEEGPGGAQDLINEGIIEKYNINEIYGLHIYPEILEGYIGIREGYFLAQSGEIDIDIIGKSGHGAMPQNTIDSVVIASNFINNLQTIVSRNISPIDNAVITIGKIEGGTIRNIVADNVRLEGTMRTFKPTTYINMKKRIKEIARGFELAYDCKIKINIKDCYPAVNNDKKLYKEFIKTIKEEKLIELEPLMIAEDFSYYQKEVPGLFFMLGARNEDKGFVHSLHNINFNFNEEILMNGLETYINLLKQKKSIN
ncbi:amidohydrolase [Romboutsia maritimum]|uniref:Amidohydrolase n=1 Tax=Romboutsia maritimum TaxID=2020948 RepID=A0A371IVF0_9FIRM|nr:amidohydrolase [Romboutsia maritimum]